MDGGYKLYQWIESNPNMNQIPSPTTTDNSNKVSNKNPKQEAVKWNKKENLK